MWLSSVFSFVESIPVVIWAAIIASLMTFTGVVISNRNNTTRLIKQLRHDSDEKAKERISTLRREVYLKAVEENSKIAVHLVSLPQGDFSNSGASIGIQEFNSAATKLQLIAEPKTALLVGELVGAYGELSMRLISLLMPLQTARTDIKLSSDSYESAHAERTRVYDKLKHLVESGVVDQIQFDALDRSFNFYAKQADIHAEARNLAWDKYNKLTREYMLFAMSELRRIGVLNAPVMIEIRRDLGLLTDIEKFREQLEQQWERMEAALVKSLDSMTE
jgi:hypothetical protein